MDYNYFGMPPFGNGGMYDMNGDFGVNPNNMNGNYYSHQQQTPMYQGTYSSLSRNNLMNSRFIKR